MTSLATVVYVMVASPSDVSDARQAVFLALSKWNDANTRGRGVVLFPLGWETDAVPELGDHPQAIINRQLLADADIVVALFGSQLGQATPNNISGTVEEIEEAVRAGKPVHLYFSTQPHANDVDVEQLKALRTFRGELERRGLYGTYANPEELLVKVWQAIETDLARIGVAAPTPQRPSGARVLVQLGGTSGSTWLELSNRGDVDVEQVRVVTLADCLHLPEDRSRMLAAGQSVRIPVFISGGDDDPRVRVTWLEGGEEHEKTFDL